MFHDVNDYETRARYAERLAMSTFDPVLREDILSLSRIYRDYAGHLRDRQADPREAGRRKAANG